MNQLIPFESAQLPAYLKAVQLSDDLGATFDNFPRISIKGKVFHITRGDDKTLITKPGESDPAASIEVVLIKAYPAGNLYSKAFYANGYTEGAVDKPVCYSNDGVAPARDSENKQATKCALCKQAQKGSRISDNGKAGKACSSSKKLAVAQPGALDDVMFLRVPGESTIALGNYGDILKKRGMPYQVVVTRIGFDYSVAHPALTFKPVGFISEEQFNDATVLANSDAVLRMVGALESVSLLSDEEENEAAFLNQPPKIEVRVEVPPIPEVPAPTASPAPATTASPKKSAAKPAPAKVLETVTDIDAGMRSALDDLDFDD